MIDSNSYVDAARIRTAAALENKIAGNARRENGPGSGAFSRMLDDNINRGSVNDRQDRKLMDACIEMESIFVSRMLKEMRNSVPKNDWLHGGNAEEIFTDMLYDEYSKSISKNSNLGIAAMMYRELSAKM